MYIRAIEAGHAPAIDNLARMLTARGDGDQAERLYAWAINAGHRQFLS